jgi:hypothetical protein
MGAHTTPTRKSFTCKNCGHHRIDHSNRTNGDDLYCFKCDCESYRERGREGELYRINTNSNAITVS